MIKKILKIFVVILLVLAVFGVYLFFTQKNNNQNSGDENKNLFSFFPFGQTEITENPETGDVPPPDTQQTKPERTSRLSQLSNTAVAGATLLKKDRLIEVEEPLVFAFVDFEGYPLMREGFEGEEVSQLENTLILINTRSLGQSTKMLFDIDTSGLLAFFQENAGLRPDGVAGRNTFLALNKAQESLLGDLTETALATRYIQKEDGSIVDIFIDTKETEVVSNTVIPRIYEAFFSENPNNLILRYLKSDNETIETFGGVVEDGKLAGSFFPKNIPFLSVSPDKTQVFYLSSVGEFTEGIISTFGDTNKRPIFEHSFSEWIPWWGTDSVITLTTKASSQTNGGAYSLTTTGSLTKNFSNKKGLTTITSPNGQKILYSENIDGVHKLLIFNKQENSHVDTGVRTIAEKCTWKDDSMGLYCGVPEDLQSSNLPDRWYQGFVSFTDTLWLLDTEANVHQLIINPKEEEGLLLDITKIQTSKLDNYLIFEDKKTSLLYGMSL
jgi:hypothetical protein